LKQANAGVRGTPSTLDKNFFESFFNSRNNLEVSRFINSWLKWVIYQETGDSFWQVTNKHIHELSDCAIDQLNNILLRWLWDCLSISN